MFEGACGIPEAMDSPRPVVLENGLLAGRSDTKNLHVNRLGVLIGDRMSSGPNTASNELDFSMVGQNQPHRGDLRVPLWNAMVTKALHPTDPMARCTRAIQAVDDELAALRREKVWREDEPIEEEDAKKQFPDAHFAGLH